MLKSIDKQFRQARRSVLRRLVDTREGRRLYADCAPPEVDYIVVSDGENRLICDPCEAVGRRILLSGGWQKRQTEAAIAHVASVRGHLANTAVLELGANIGSQTVYFARSGQFARIVAVEPAPANAAVLRSNVVLNGFTESVTVIEAAVSTLDGRVSLYLCDENSGSHSMIGTDGGASVEVESLSLPTLLARANLSPADIGFAWVDIEGLDKVIVPALVELVGDRVPIHLEFAPHPAAPDEDRAFLRVLKDRFSQIHRYDRETEAFVIIDPERLAATPVHCDSLVLNP